ncbi:hypothetical protein GmHk_04G010859 [Glycine max]|nr:hypothetical protein GmHk_04G010859 [Glycine max]
MVSRGGDKSDECLFHLVELHDMETCPAVEELLQRLMDWGQLEVSERNRVEPQVYTQSAERKASPTPKALVICFTRNRTSPRSEYPPTVPKPTPFSYRSNKVVPWKYTPPTFGEGAATEVDSLSAKVTNITGLSGVTRSGRVFGPPHLAEFPSKGKAPMTQESAGAATPSKEMDPPVVKGAEKKEGLQGKVVTLEEDYKFLRLIQQSEFKVVEQLNRTPARISLLELLINSEPHRALLVKVLNEAHDSHGNADVVDIRGNPYKYGLGYEPGKPGRRNTESGPFLLHSNGDMWHSLNKIIEKEKTLFKTKKHLSLSPHSAQKKFQKLSLSLTQPSSSFLPPPLLPNKASTFGAHFCSKSRKEGIFGVVKRVSTCRTSKFQIVMAAQLIHDRVEMECLEGAWETLEGNTRCRFRGTIRFMATSLVHPDEPVRTLQRTVEWILPTPTPYRLVEPVQVIEVTSSEEDPEEDLEELPLEPAMDALDFLEGDEDPLLEVDSPEEVMSASEADSTEDSGPGEMAISGGSSS